MAKLHCLWLLLVFALAGCDRPASDVSVAAPTSASAPVVDAHFLIPGDYRQATTVAELQARFGKDNVRVVEEPDRGLLLFPADPSRRARVRFHHGETLEELASIEVADRGSRWRGKHGVHVGMSLKRLRALNGKPFHFVTDGDGGTARVNDQWSAALDADDSTLGRFDVEEGDHVYFYVELGARDAAAPPTPFPAEDVLSSDDPRLAGKDEQIVVTAFGGATSLDDEWD